MKCYEFACEIADQFGEHGFGKLVDQVLSKTFIIEICMEDSVEVFEIFERTNARGKPLTIPDLLKNFLFSNHKMLVGQDPKKEWDEISNNSTNSIQRMLKFFMISRAGTVSKRQLYRALKKYSEEIGVKNFVFELKEFSKFYRDYYDDSEAFARWLEHVGHKMNAKDENQIRASHDALEKFGVTQIIPLVFSASLALSDMTDKSQASHLLAQLMRMFESYHFINNKVCSRIGNDIEKLYHRNCEQLWQKPSEVKDILEDLRKQLNLKLASAAEFEGALSSIQLKSMEKNSQRSVPKYILARILKERIHEAKQLNIFSEQKSGNNDEFSVLEITADYKLTDKFDIVFPTQVLVPSLFYNSVKSKQPNEIWRHVKELIQDERASSRPNIVGCQFSGELDIWPNSDSSKKTRMMKLSSTAYFIIANDIAEIRFDFKDEGNRADI